MVLKTSFYQLKEESEYHLIKHKEASKNLRLDHPDIIDNVGVDKQIGTDKKDEEVKLIK